MQIWIDIQIPLGRSYRGEKNVTAGICNNRGTMDSIRSTLRLPWAARSLREPFRTFSFRLESFLLILGPFQTLSEVLQCREILRKSNTFRVSRTAQERFVFNPDLTWFRFRSIFDMCIVRFCSKKKQLFK